MTDLWHDIQQKLKDLMGGWASYAALGTFSLYVLGYLAIRFHLTALGIGTDLAVLDERYVFAGAKFLVYFFSNLPIVMLFAFLIAPLALILKYVTQKVVLLLKSITKKLLNRFKFLTKRKNANSPMLLTKLKWFSTPNGAAFLGIAIAVLLIQIVMRKSFWFSNILLEGFPDSGIGLESLLFSKNETGKLFYFLGLLSGTTICAAVWLYASGRPGRNSLSKYLSVVLASLVVMQFLFLAIYYGVFVMDKSIPRVVDLGDQVSLAKNQKAWLIWEGNQGATYLVHETGCSAPVQKDGVPGHGVAPSSSSPESGTSNSHSPLNSSAASTLSNSAVNRNATPTVDTDVVSSTPSPAPQNENQQQAAAKTPAPTPTSSPVTQSNQPTTLCTAGATVPPDGIIRKLVTLQQKDSNRIQILGYDSIATLSFPRGGVQP